MKKVCLVDLDDTLGDLKNPMMEALGKHTGVDIHWSTWEAFDVPKIHDSGYSFINQLKMLGYYVVIITARGWHPDAFNLTDNWVREHNLNIDELLVIDNNQSKTDVIKKFNNIAFSVDDRIRNCRDYIQSGLADNVILYSAPWNHYMTRWNRFWKGYDYHYRVNDLHEIFELLDIFSSSCYYDYHIVEACRNQK